MLRKSPPILPMGFRAGFSDELLVIDLIDSPNPETRSIFYSLALTKSMSIELINILDNFVKGNNFDVKDESVEGESE